MLKVTRGQPTRELENEGRAIWGVPDNQFRKRARTWGDPFGHQDVISFLRHDPDAWTRANFRPEILVINLLDLFQYREFFRSFRPSQRQLLGDSQRPLRFLKPIRRPPDNRMDIDLELRPGANRNQQHQRESHGHHSTPTLNRRILSDIIGWLQQSSSPAGARLR